MARGDPAEFLRRTGETLERVGNRVQIEDGDGNPNDVDAPLIVSDPFTAMVVSDETLNDSDKTLLVPAGRVDHVLSIWIEFATGAGADRQIVVEILDDGTDVIAQWRAGVVQGASVTRYYSFAPANADLTAFRDDDYLMTPIPPGLILPAGFGVRVYDNNAVAVAADDLIVQMLIGRRWA